MKLSQIGSRLQKLMMVTVLSVGHFAVAAEHLNVRQVEGDFNQQLKQIYADKNRPFPGSLTKPVLSSGLSKNKKLEIPKSFKGPRDEVKMGGVSDGGGNAVGSTLFDFYENEGSLKISIQEMISLEPKTKQILNYLNRKVPAVGSSHIGSGYGDELVDHLKNKSIYLESKGISSEGCKNQSLVSAGGQAVVACQSDSELRLSVQWLQATDANNRAGLFLHELILAWARSEFEHDDKVKLEQKVRELNRQIFSSLSNDMDIAQFIEDTFGIQTWNPKAMADLKALPEAVYKATVAFCANPQGNPVESFGQFISKYDIADMPTLRPLQSVWVDLVMGRDTEEILKAKADLCEDYVIDSTPIQEQKSRLPKKCMASLDTAVEDLLKFQNGNVADDVSSVESKKVLFAKTISVTKVAANSCAIIAKDESKKTYFEAISYVRRGLYQKGMTISFMRNSWR